jgi:hypothetical protein
MNMDSIRLQVIYDGVGPVHWKPAPDGFGMQDKKGNLLLGNPGPGGAVVFDATLATKAGNAGELILAGEFAHGPPTGRFLYLSWRNSTGSWAQRLKLPLAGIGWDVVGAASARDVPVVGHLIDHHPRATTTGANIGGTRAIAWTLP